MHGLNPRTILWKNWWDVVRQEAYSSTDYHCAACGVHKSKVKWKNKWLEAHELYDIDFEKCTYTLSELVPLCPYCHSYIHSWFLSVLYEKGTISEETFDIIITHGDTIIKNNNLNKEDIITKMCAWRMNSWFPEDNWTWSKWHLVIEGKKYYSKFKNYNEWLLHYNN